MNEIYRGNVVSWGGPIPGVGIVEYADAFLVRLSHVETLSGKPLATTEVSTYVNNFRREPSSGVRFLGPGQWQWAFYRYGMNPEKGTETSFYEAQHKAGSRWV